MKDTKWYDYEGLITKPYKLFIINGIMDDGKSFGSKLYAYKNFKKTGKCTLFLYNGFAQMEEEIYKFKTDLCEVEPAFNDFTVERVNKWTAIGKIGEKQMCEFRSISGNVKTGRETTKFNMLVYDEFNFMDTRIANIQVRNFGTLLSRHMRNLDKVVLIGNAVSLNTPILFKFKIYEIKDEYTEFNVGDMKGLFHLFKRDMREIDEKYKDSISYAMINAFGMGKHAFENQFLLDDLNNIVDIPDKVLNKKGELRDVYKYQDKWIYEYRYTENNTTVSYFKIREEMAIKDLPKYRYALDRDNLEEGIKFLVMKLMQIGRKIQTDKTYYQNVSVKQILRKSIKKYINW